VTEHVAIVTGAASGIGQATAARLCRDGWSVVGVDVSDAVLREPGPGRYEGVVGDVRDRSRAYEVVARTLDRNGRLDALVAAAGIERDGPLESLDPELWDLVIDTCLKGTLAYCAAAIPPMREQGSGGIVTFGSVLGRASLPGCGVYAAAKAGLEALSRTLAIDLAPSGIRVNCMLPGTTDTPLVWQNLREDEIAEAKRAAAGEIPLGFVADPADIANVVAFLLSADARFITGQSIVADGGTLAKIAASY
jgi:meso-butanediol dehydrogenase / (S,S)-butanediol dehydrogenase / diacetyl reductase